ncbi:unnamed protein product [Sordaria macrospora k-hell]|uniref:WGS project CABT00000000 data, contig 2.19 n=1 Tax=Sordaria macrospora (strain ATCC MYA-333 / DSM 997 / K(L3346) / K-hell) TaxID=771870 RepID=F7W1A1_SORMK|nr:uncharacterized protein SMAC_04243 [Sordaria macrospora k-hell]CCC04876.1 unnamed protein product [Sordaria macrospora k-hell]
MDSNLSRKPPPLRLSEQAVPMVAQRGISGGDCPRGYQWYTCNAIDGPPYAGCCAMDPCRPEMAYECPDQYQPGGGAITSSTIVITSTADHGTSTVTQITTIRSSADSDPAPTLTSQASSTSTAVRASSTASATATVTPDAPPTVIHKDLSVGAIVGIAVGCSLAFIFFAISVCIWWGRRRTKKDEKKDSADTANVSSFLGPTDLNNPAGRGQDKNMSQSGSRFPGGSYQPVPTGTPYEYRGQGEPAELGIHDQHELARLADGLRESSFQRSDHSEPQQRKLSGQPNFPSRGASELDINQGHQQGGWARFEPMHEIPELDGNGIPPQHS